MSHQATIDADRRFARFSLTQPLERFCFLWLITLGLYGLHWHYMNWRSFSEVPISAAGLTILSNATVYPLAKQVFRLARWQGIPVYVAPSIIWITYFTGNLLGTWFSNFWFMVGLLLTLIPMLYIQHLINEFWKNFSPEKEQLAFLAKGFWGWTMTGLIIWTLTIMSINAVIV